MKPAALDKVYDVLLSYRRTDQAFAVQLAERLHQHYDVAAFIDEKGHEAGHDWQSYWHEALRGKPNPKLDPNIGPGVVVLTTDAILEPKDNDHVVREIADALAAHSDDHVIPIAALTFSRPGYAELRRRLGTLAGYDALSNLHHPHIPAGIPVAHPDQISQKEWDAVCEAVVRVARAATLRRLRQLRKQTADWAQQILGNFFTKLDLSGANDEIRQLHASVRAAAEKGGRHQLAIVGPGGVGKTAQLARVLHDICTDSANRLFPILLQAHEVEEGITAVRRKLGLGPNVDAEPLSNVTDIYAWGQARLVFVTDSLERADNIDKAAATLNQLQETAGLFVTCRPEGWEKANAILQFSSERDSILTIGEIGDKRVAELLAVDRNFVIARPFLRQALFIDIAAYLLDENHFDGERKKRALECTTALLDELRRWAVEGDARSDEFEDFKEPALFLLQRIANEQIRLRRFAIDKSSVISDDPRDKQIYNHLRDKHSYIIEESIDGQHTVRLRHDVIDSDAIARALMADPDLRKTILEQQEFGFCQIVAEGMSQRAHDTGRKEILGEVVDAFLIACDNKNHEPYQSRGWNTGFVIQAKFPIYRPLLISCMSGEFLGDKQPEQPGETVSSRVNRLLTQNTLSSVASTFRGAKPCEFEDSEGRELGLLAKLIADPRVKWRARIVEAISRYRNADGGSLKLLVALLGEQTLMASDPGLMVYIAESIWQVLRKTGSVADVEQARTEIDTAIDTALASEEMRAKMDSPTIRRVLKQRNAVADLASLPLRPEPELTIDEIRQGLSLAAFGNPTRVSDWVIFVEYAARLRIVRGVIGGAVSEEAIFALGRGLWHDHIICHVAALRALGMIDHAFARGLVLYALATRKMPRVEDEAIEALEQHARHVRDRPVMKRALMLALARTMAARCEEGDASANARLVHIAERLGWTGETIATPSTIELSIMPPLEAGGSLPPAPELTGDAQQTMHNAENYDPAPLTGTSGAAHTFHTAVFGEVFSVPIIPRASFRGMGGDSVSEAAVYDQRVERYVETIARSYRMFEDRLNTRPAAP